jgi:cell wall-associated NlpC family hydrolase
MVLAFFVALVVVGAAGIKAESAPKPASTAYSEVVGNSIEGRFEADESWQMGSYRLDRRGENYLFARPSPDGTPARFKVKIPETANYAVYARWPEVGGLNDSVPVGVETTSGVEWKRVNQQRDGGRWVRIGVFEMASGDDYSIRFSTGTEGEGYVAADAVRVIKAPSATAPSGISRSDSSAETLDQGGSTRQDVVKEVRTGGSRSPRGASASHTGQDVVKEARAYMKVPYRLGRASRSGMDCSGLTMLVYRKFGVSMPHDVRRQYSYGSRVSGPPQAGDLVFFDEHGRGLSHVGIATGRGTIVHASNYWKRVTETQIKYIKGYKGAKRLVK